MTYLIYKLTNKENGKIYIGKTSDLKRRIRQHRKQSSCRYLYRAIQKYGIESFDVEILKENLTFEEGCKYESSFLKEFNSLAPNGYNLVEETGQGRNPSKSTRKLMSKANQKKGKACSKYHGVFKHKKRKRYRSRIKHEDISYCKYFDSEIEAASFYDRLAILFFGKEARINFPENLDSYLKENLDEYKKYAECKFVKTSIYKCVSFHKASNKWRAYKYVDKKQVSLGLFEKEEDAYKATLL